MKVWGSRHLHGGGTRPLLFLMGQRATVGTWTLELSKTQPQVTVSLEDPRLEVFSAAVVRDGDGLALRVLAGDPDNPTTIVMFEKVADQLGANLIRRRRLRRGRWRDE